MINNREGYAIYETTQGLFWKYGTLLKKQPSYMSDDFAQVKRYIDQIKNFKFVYNGQVIENANLEVRKIVVKYCLRKEDYNAVH